MTAEHLRSCSTTIIITEQQKHLAESIHERTEHLNELLVALRSIKEGQLAQKFDEKIRKKFVRRFLKAKKLSDVRKIFNRNVLTICATLQSCDDEFLKSMQLELKTKSLDKFLYVADLTFCFRYPGNAERIVKIWSSLQSFRMALNALSLLPQGEDWSRLESLVVEKILPTGNTKKAWKITEKMMPGSWKSKALQDVMETLASQGKGEEALRLTQALPDEPKCDKEYAMSAILDGLEKRGEGESPIAKEIQRKLPAKRRFYITQTGQQEEWPTLRWKHIYP